MFTAVKHEDHLLSGIVTIIRSANMTLVEWPTEDGQTSLHAREDQA